MIDQENIYREYREKVMGYLCHKLNNPANAEDLCSEVFLKVTENIGDFDPQKASISTWIYCITRNTLYDYFRTNHEMCELDESFAVDDDFTENLCNDETLENLAGALETLSARERETIVRHYYNNEKLKDIATKMDISYSYVKIIHQTALKKIKKILELH